jgi:iron complex transport system substrate-binding protein
LRQAHGDGIFSLSKQNNFHRYSVLLFLAIVLGGLTLSWSCKPRQEAGKSETTNSTIEITDETGKRFRIPAKLERVVSLAPNLTEIIYAVGAGDRLVGNTTFCNYPEEAKSVAKVGDTMQPNIESIIALRPQLVLVSTASQLEAFTRQMTQQNIPVYVTDPKDFEGVLRTIQSLGGLFGNHDKATQVVSDLRARARAVEEAVKSQKPVKVFYQLSREPLYTAGRDSFITDLIKRAGGQSVTADVPGAWPTFSQESALAAKPEVIILPTFDSMGQGETDVAAALKNSPAAKSKRVYGINGDLLSRPGPRLVDGLEEMARKLHPDAFR